MSSRSHKVALTVDVYTYLRRLGEHCDVYWNYVSNGDLVNIRREAEELIEIAVQPWVELYKCSDTSVPNLDRETMKWFLRDSLFTSLVTRKVMLFLIIQ